MDSLFLTIALAVTFIAVGEILARVFPGKNIHEWPGGKQPGPEFYGIYYPSQDFQYTSDMTDEMRQISGITPLVGDGTARPIRRTEV